MKCVLLNVLKWHSTGIVVQNQSQRKNMKYEYHSHIFLKKKKDEKEKVASSED